MDDTKKNSLFWRLVSACVVVKGSNVPLHAAYAGYFFILALFPILTLILSLLNYAGIQVETLIELLNDILPRAMMAGAEELVKRTYADGSGAVVGLSVLTALWAASRGIYGLLRGLNAIYGVSEDRGYFFTRAISVVYTFFFLLVVLLTLVLHVFGNTIVGLLHSLNFRPLSLVMDLIDLRFFLLLIVQSLIFTGMFMALPNRRNRFWDSLPGGVVSSLGWLVFSDLFSIYVENFSNYSSVYGSVYAVAISMLWLYCCMSILFYGGALNRYLMGSDE